MSSGRREVSAELGRRRRGLPWQRGLRARLVAYFLLLSAVTIAVVGAVVYGRATGDLTRSVFDRLGAVAEVKADSLDRWIDEQRRNLVFVGNVPGFGDAARTAVDPDSTASEREAAREAVAALMGAAVRLTSDAQELLLLDLGGTIRASTMPDHEGASQAGEPYFQEGSSRTAVQNAYTSALTGQPTITVSTPLFDSDGRGRRVGVLAAHLNLERIDRIVLERTGLGQSGRTYLVGPDHRFLHARLNDGLPEAGARSIGIDAALGGADGEALYLDYEGVPVIGVYRWIREHEAALLVELGQEEAFAPARQLALIILLVGGASAALLAAGIWLIARRVTRPILALASTASRVAGGDLDARSDIVAHDEVGTLAVAFDHMTTQLRENVEMLERRVEERTAELSRALTEVGRQKQYFQQLVEISPVAIVTMDRNEMVSGWNPAAAALFGYEPEQAFGRHIDELIFSPDERAEGAAATRLADETGRAQLIGRRRRRDGEVVDVEIVLVPLVVDGEHTGYYAIYHDITELEAARRAADAANEAKSSFLAAMSHEIRTPMNAVIGMSGLLLETPLDSEQRDYAESISSSAEALLTIINDILDFSKIEAGRFELETASFDLLQTVRATVELIRPLAERKNLALGLITDGEPPPLLGDAGRLRQIVINLLSNATKFTERGGIEVVLRARPVDRKGAATEGAAAWRIELSVSDTGIGIPQEAMSRLFDSFSQADASISRRYGGTGLGLAISRRLAELMGGSLVAHSSGVPGDGSRFELAFVADVAPVIVEIGPEPAGGQPETSAVRIDPGLRILLAEDNSMNQKLALRLLERMGLRADVAVNGLEAVAALERTPYDVVLMDVEMPELDGLEATRRIRAAEHDRRPWIVAMTASAMAGDREACLAAGMDEYVSKPIRPEALRAAIVAASAQAAEPA